ncbi:hypothetical protein Ae263Ps1_1354 [Pseudonocardia sp. Ae263_Ps1]|nr:hypothetical protein Ae150APs1_3971c [Pseudonocardia sp. Ae150A_Ps1]OLL84299.1 hypothetical protein Ae263Ps1_1354 [Pseudonocardia sp. Ae263_Ps1]
MTSLACCAHQRLPGVCLALQHDLVADCGSRGVVPLICRAENLEVHDHLSSQTPLKEFKSAF